MKKLFSIVPLTIFFSTSACAQHTKFGVLIFGKNNVGEQIKICKDLGVDYVRDGVTMDRWNGSLPRVEKFSSAGIKVLLNIGWGHANQGNGVRTPVPFPTDTVQYKKILNDILDKYKPEVAVIENEELTQAFHSGPIQDYINELTAAVNVCHSKGVKVTNGGLRTIELCFLVYQDYLKRGLNKEAQGFRSRAFSERMKKALDNPGSDQLYDKFLQDGAALIEAYKKLPLDYVNIHYYEPVNKNPSGNGISPASDVIKAITDYVRNATGKEVMSNEMGQFNTNPDLAKNLLSEFAKNNYAYALWFSGDGPFGEKALHNIDGSLRSNGVAVKGFIAEHKNQ